MNPNTQEIEIVISKDKLVFMLQKIDTMLQNLEQSEKGGNEAGKLIIANT